jgi:hypothetical protein
MVRVGEEQGILTLKHYKSTLGAFPNNVRHHYGAEPSFHRSASESIPALVSVRV